MTIWISFHVPELQQRKGQRLIRLPGAGRIVQVVKPWFRPTSGCRHRPLP